MTEFVVSLDGGAELDLTAVDIGTADRSEVLAFNVEGMIRGLNSDLLEMIRGESIVPTEIHFRIEGE